MAGPKLAVVDVLNVTFHRYIIRYFNLISRLGNEEVVFFCNGRFRQTFPAYAARLDEMGVEVVEDDYDRALSHQWHLVSTSVLHFEFVFEMSNTRPATAQCWVQASDLFHELKKRQARFIFQPSTSEGIESPGWFYPPGSFILAPFESALRDTAGWSDYFHDQNGRLIAYRTACGQEVALTGPLHMDQPYLDAFGREKSDLRAELADRLKARFRPDRPLLVYMPTHYIETDQADKGLVQLARQADIVVKIMDETFIEHKQKLFRQINECSSWAEGPGLYRVADSSLNPLIRAAADFNLVCPRSSDLVTSLMLGRRVIPIYSSHPCYIYRQNVSRFFNADCLCNRLNWHLGPLPIRSPDLIMERIRDREYWREYDQWLPRLRERYFGQYWLGDEALDRAVSFTRRALKHGSFVPPELEGHGRPGCTEPAPPLEFYSECLL